ncbi:auxin response factor 6-like [Schistocerca americana]|uniref:auxin response factor 6-like n=1 Tax=Schistocerca americana TaxID=7009 RepID=UPI001F4F3776|nr:auxin response factor 6-like [Schistocerca americana]
MLIADGRGARVLQLNQQAQAESEQQQQLSQQQQQQLNGFIESSPIYVTSLQSQAGSGALSNGHAPQPPAQSQSEDSGDTLELKQDLSDDQEHDRDQPPAANTTVTTAIVEAPAHEQLIDNNAGSRCVGAAERATSACRAEQSRQAASAAAASPGVPLRLQGVVLSRRHQALEGNVG